MEEEKAEEEREEEGKKERRIRKVELYPGMEMMGGRGMHVNRDLKSERHECHETPFCRFFFFSALRAKILLVQVQFRFNFSLGVSPYA